MLFERSIPPSPALSGPELPMASSATQPAQAKFGRG
jgi:hypothetical protein